MSSFNQVTIMGNLVRDIEIRFTPGNKAVGNSAIAVNETWKDASGAKQESTTFVDIEMWEKTAEMMKQYLAKGSPVLVSGRLKQDVWKDKADGSNRSKLKVVVDRFTFVGGKDRAETAPPSTAPKPDGGWKDAGGAPMPDQDIPFAHGFEPG